MNRSGLLRGVCLQIGDDVGPLAGIGMPGKASAIGESGIIAFGSAIHLSMFSSVQTKPLSPSFFMPGEIGEIGHARGFAPDDPVELGSDQGLGAGADLMADAAFGEGRLALGGVALGKRRSAKQATQTQSSPTSWKLLISILL